MADVPAGTWTLVADGIIVRPVDVTFELIWRQAAGDDVELARWEQHFEPLGAGVFDAQPYEVTAEAEAIEYESGDLLVLRYTGESEQGMDYIPNGEGPLSGGRYPYVDLPQE